MMKMISLIQTLKYSPSIITNSIELENEKLDKETLYLKKIVETFTEGKEL